MGFRDLLKQAKTGVYRVVATLEDSLKRQQGSNDGSAPATSVQSGVLDILKTCGQAASERMHEAHHRVQGSGGYGAMAGRAAERVGDALQKRVVDPFAKTLDDLMTNGEFDPNKVEQYLTGRGRATQQLGVRAVDTLRIYARNGTDTIKRDYRALVPTPEERATTYAGIGSKYDGLLLRPDLDACLAFQQAVNSVLPKSLTNKPEILNDICDYGIGNYGELDLLYRTTKGKEPLLLKIQNYQEKLLQK
ncbi:hypothetical protein HZB02_03440 [Candidatus Woesearchaeota archaeon]|nr:hypothetical protein [Candidatus Woesearchaeota archaeon]